MKCNTDPSFVGYVILKRSQEETLQSFRACAAAGNWLSIHRGHYDWWMFPVDEPSSYGFAYTVYDGDIAALKEDGEYVSRYLEGAVLLARAWGWDLEGARHIEQPAEWQCWQDWPVRLYKATKSLKLFGFDAPFESFKAYGQSLLATGVSFTYRRDLTWLFR